MGGVENSVVLAELERLKKRIQKKYNLEEMILFGSRAQGEELLTSDVDLLVVSDGFSGIPFRKRPDFLLDNWKLSVDLEVLCYSSSEFERKKKEIGLVSEAVKTGIVL